MCYSSWTCAAVRATCQLAAAGAVGGHQVRRQQLQELRGEAPAATTRPHVAGPLRVLEIWVLCAQAAGIGHPTIMRWAKPRVAGVQQPCCWGGAVMAREHPWLRLGGRPHLVGRAPPPAGRRSTAAGRGSSSAAAWHAESCVAGWGSRNAPPAWHAVKVDVQAQRCLTRRCELESLELAIAVVRPVCHDALQHSAAIPSISPASASAGGTP